MSDWKIAPEDLAAFEAVHGTVRVKRTVGPVKAKQPPLTAEVEFGQCFGARMPEALFVREHLFHPERKWRFDYAFLDQKLAVEIEGQGRHQTYVGFRGDCEKYNSAVLHGWRVLRFVAAERKHMADWVETTVRALCGLDDT